MITTKISSLFKVFLFYPFYRSSKLRTLATLLCFWVLPYQGYGFDYKVTKLGNGITLITAYFSHAPLVSTYVNFNRGGAMTETKASDGLTHLFEHMFMRSNKLVTNHKDFKKKLRELGASANASTGIDTLDYYLASYPAVYFEQGVELMAAVARTIKIEPKTLANEISIVLDELDRSLTRPFFAPWATKNHILWGEDLYHAIIPIGTQRKVIENATVSQIEELKDLLFAPQNTTIFITGLVSHGKAYKTVKKYFGDWKNPPSWKPPPIPKLPNITKTQRWNFSHPRYSTTSLRFDFPTFNSTEETYAADLLSELLAHRSSTFYKKYIESGKWLSGGYSMANSSFRPSSQISIELKSKEDTVDETITEVLEELNKWSEKDYFSEPILDETKKSFLLHFRAKGDHFFRFTSSLIYFSMKVDPYYYKTYPQGLQKTTLEDIRQFVKTQLINQPYFLTVKYNPEDAQKWGVDLAGDRYYKKHIEPKLVSTNTQKEKTP